MTEGSEPAVHWEAPVERAGPAPGIDFAPHGSRLLAYVIDSLILTMVFFGWFLASVIGVGVVGAVFGRTWMTDNPFVVLLAIVWMFVLMLVYALYFPYFWARGGQTPGMRPFRLWVVRDTDGTALTWRPALLRMIGMFFVSGILYLGFVWVFIDKRRRAWHDLIAGTIVIRRR